MLLRVGHPSIPWQSLHETLNIMSVLVVEDGKERHIGEMRETIEHFTQDWRRVIRRTQELRSEEIGDRKTVSEVVANSFVPISHHDQTADEELLVTYKGKTVTVEDSTGKDIVMLHDVVFDSHSVEMIIRLLPRKFTELAVPVFRPAVKAASEVNISANHGEHQSVATVDFGNITQRYHLDGKSIIRQESPLDEHRLLVFQR